MKKILYTITMGGLLLTSHLKGQVVLEALEGGDPKCLYQVKDRNYDNSNGWHKFIYCAVEGPDGKIWLNLNLGAEYAREGSPHFNPAAQPKNIEDSYAFGSNFQHGRRPDGHELVDRYEKNTQNNTWLIYKKFASKNERQADAFNTNRTYSRMTYRTALKYSEDVYGWYLSFDTSDMWSGLYRNNPCPVGFRVASSQDIRRLVELNLTRQGGLGTAMIYGNENFSLVFGPVVPNGNHRYNQNASILTTETNVLDLPSNPANTTSSLLLQHERNVGWYKKFDGTIENEQPRESKEGQDFIFPVADNGIYWGGFNGGELVGSIGVSVSAPTMPMGVRWSHGHLMWGTASAPVRCIKE